jgi:hypothetical protein
MAMVYDLAKQLTSPCGDEEEAQVSAATETVSEGYCCGLGLF